MREAGLEPSFVLKNIKDLPSPVGAALRKHAERRAERARTGRRQLLGATREGLLPDTKRDAKSTFSTALVPIREPGQTGYSLVTSEDKTVGEGDGEAAPSWTQCIAIYPYLARRGDEFDVAVGDTFLGMHRGGLWALARRAPGATGESARVRYCYVPRSCLLEVTGEFPSLAP